MRNLILLLTLLFFVKCGVLTNNPVIYQPSAANSEAAEYNELMAKDQINKTQETAKVLTYLLNDSEPDDPYTAAVIDNASDCNIILRLTSINGKQIYNLPVPKNGKNQFVIAKGSYTLKSNICNAKYYSQKTVTDALILKLSSR